MSTFTQYELFESFGGRCGGLLEDDDNGNAEQHLEYLLKKYGHKLRSAVHQGEMIWPQIMQVAS
ncbi:MAG: hypothetical protein VXW65_14535 [Pseudomonadota bacterium]|nr:hypothetical protein [Pseudomonadota bacterium]